MHPVKKAYCRVFQVILHIAIPFLPYRRPKVLSSVTDIPGCLEKSVFAMY